MVERVSAVREAVGSGVDLAIDMHGRYDIASGIAVARAGAVRERANRATAASSSTVSGRRVRSLGTGHLLGRPRILQPLAGRTA